jgi:hypothetical protein
MLDFVKIAVFSFPHEYAVLQLLLENKNVRFFFQNETAIGVMPFYSNAIGGILLKVHPDDVDTAEMIVEKFNEGNTDLKVV